MTFWNRIVLYLKRLQKSEEPSKRLLPLIIMKPCVAWSQPAKIGPYERWKNLQVAVGTINDLCGCARKRFREHCQTYPQRWGMYYELVEDVFDNGNPNQRVDFEGYSKSLIVKLYAPQQGFGRAGFTQAAFNHELVWVARPCEIHGRKLSDMERRGCGAQPPQHMIDYLKKNKLKKTKWRIL